MITKDNSVTLYSEYFDENCHSTSGAIAETDFNYIEGFAILEKVKKLSSISIFEVGYGLGIGAVRTFDLLEKESSSVSFLSCELDEELVKWTIETSSHPLLRGLERIALGDSILYENKIGPFMLTIIIGDIRQSLIQLCHDRPFVKFNAIYQDAFSPKKNPTLWTTQWFELLKLNADKDCILSTYSAAMPVRKSLLNAGWNVFKREGYGEKRSTTIARFDRPMIPEFQTNIQNSPEASLNDK